MHLSAYWRRWTDWVLTTDKRQRIRLAMSVIVREWQADYYVRDLSLASEIDLSRLVALLQERGAWRQTLCQRVPVWAVSCRDFIQIASELLASAPYALIRAGGESHAV